MLQSVDEETLVCAINKCKTLLNSIETTQKVVTWNERMMTIQDDWTKARNAIFNCVVSAESHSSAKCSFCLVNDSWVRCHQCGLSFTLGETCDERVHSLATFMTGNFGMGGFLKLVHQWKNRIDTEIESGIYKQFGYVGLFTFCHKQ